MKDLPLSLTSINAASDISPKLEEKLRGFLQCILDGARAAFERDGECCPFFFALKDGEIIPIAFKEFTPETKHQAFELIQQMSDRSDAGISVNEVWMAQALKSEFADGEHDSLLAPSQRLDRREMVMVVVRMKDRRISLIAEISRKPNSLGVWEIMEDTAVEGLAKAEGPMIGVPFTRKGKS